METIHILFLFQKSLVSPISAKSQGFYISKTRTNHSQSLCQSLKVPGLLVLLDEPGINLWMTWNFFFLSHCHILKLYQVSKCIRLSTRWYICIHGIFYISLYNIKETFHCKRIVYDRNYGRSHMQQSQAHVSTETLAPFCQCLINLLDYSFMASHRSKAENADCVLLL